MPESETSNKMIKVIKAFDKLLENIQKDGRKVAEAVRELKKDTGDDKKESV